MSDQEAGNNGETQSRKRPGRKRHNSIANFSRSSQRAAWARNIGPQLREMILGAAIDSNAPSDEQGPSTSENTPLLGTDAEHLEPLSTKLSGRSKARIEHLNRQREEARKNQNEQDQQGLLIKKMSRPDGMRADIIVGQSTLPQTVFNSSNVLLGVGMLGLPLGIHYAGWVIGLTFLVFSAGLTKYTASLLADCMDVDSSLANFADIAYIAFGEKGRLVTSTVFTLELVAACISLVILFADSLHSLIPSLDVLHWKIICGIILAPVNFIPMRYLSYTSFLGIFCVFALLIVIIIDGCLKPESPGSLINPARTYAFPEHWKALPLSFGLIMAPWGGHSVFPNIYRDMRHPWKYERGLRYIFTFTTSMDLLLAVIGLIMFGDAITDELTKNVLNEKQYPYALNVLVLVLISIIPLTKFPLNCFPIVSTFEVLAGIDARAASVKPNALARSKFLSYLLKAFFRVFAVLVIVLLAVLVPSFELISAIMGALFCFLICIIAPIAFHLRMLGDQLSRTRWAWEISVMVAAGILGIAGTIWEFLPRRWMGFE